MKRLSPGCLWLPLTLFAVSAASLDASAQSVTPIPAPNFGAGVEFGAVMPLAKSNPGSMLFLGVDGTLLAGNAHGSSETAYNAGAFLGYRMRSQHGVLGAWVGADFHQGRFGNTFSRGIAGVEFSGSLLIARFGGFVPFENTSSEWSHTTTTLSAPDPNFFGLQNRHTETLTLVEKAPSGIDGEIGIRIPVARHSISVPPLELRLFAGGYSYFGAGANGGDINGTRARAELDLYSSRGAGDMRVTLLGQYTQDDLMGSQGRAGIRFAFPLGGSGASTNTCCETRSGSIKDSGPAPAEVADDRGMSDPVWRNRELATSLRVRNSNVVDEFVGAGAAASDRRLKRDVELLFTSADGIRVYSFRYLADIDPSGTAYVGVMAQDLLETHPEAVVTMDNGYYAVRYDLIGQRMTTQAAWVQDRLSVVDWPTPSASAAIGVRTH